MIVGGIYFYQDKEKNLAAVNEKIDLVVPQVIQDNFSNGWDIISENYNLLEARADVWRSNVKAWSILESVTLVESITGQDLVSTSNSFSPILDNTSIVFSLESSIQQKLYGAFLFMVTLLFWNFKIFAVWICLLLYKLITATKKKFFPKRKKSFFDKINERVDRSDPDDAY